MANICKKCIVWTCESPTNVSYHRFPKDHNLYNEWMKSCKLETIKIKTPNICGIHFEKHDFIEDKINKLLGLKLKMRLKPNAIPTLNLPTSYKNTSKTTLKPTLKPTSIIICPSVALHHPATTTSSKPSKSKPTKVKPTKLKPLKPKPLILKKSSNNQISESKSPKRRKLNENLLTTLEPSNTLSKITSNTSSCPTSIKIIESFSINNEKFNDDFSELIKIENLESLSSLQSLKEETDDKLTKIENLESLSSLESLKEETDDKFISHTSNETASKSVQVNPPSSSNNSTPSPINIEDDMSKTKLIKKVNYLKKRNKRLSNKIKLMKLKNSRLKSTKHKKTRLKKILAKYFINNRDRLKFRVDDEFCEEWRTEDFVVAIIIKFMSEKTFKFLRNNKLLSLPSTSSVQNWIRNYVIPTGVQLNISTILEILLKVKYENYPNGCLPVIDSYINYFMNQ